MSERMTRRRLLELLGGIGGVTLAPLGLGATQKATGSAGRPNIVFILADDLGYGDLGYYGQEVIQTPNLDRMAAEGIRFTQCYAGSTVCAPSRCCLMTGLHTGHARVRGNALVPLRPEDVTVAEVLKQAGYATALIGKWGLGEPDTTGLPNRKGFDTFFGYLNQAHAHNTFPTYLWRNEGKVAIEGNVESKEHRGVCSECKVFSNDLFTQEALRFIEQKGVEQPPSAVDEAKAAPFFLYLAYTIPHANNERGGATGDGMETPSYEPYADMPWPQPQKGHAALITRLDRDVGAVLQKLKDLGLDDNTIVFFTSDNGTHKEGGANPKFFKSSGPLRGYKRDLYEGGIRVPMIVRWPGKIKPGTVSEHVWAFWDFLPTAADLANAKTPVGLDGVSVVPSLLGGREDGLVPKLNLGTRLAEPLLYWEFHERGFMRAARMGNWKAVSLEPDKPIELYDLSTDIGETRNIADKHPDIVKRIEEYLKTARTDSENWPAKK